MDDPSTGLVTEVVGGMVSGAGAGMFLAEATALDASTLPAP